MEEKSTYYKCCLILRKNTPTILVEHISMDTKSISMLKKFYLFPIIYIVYCICCVMQGSCTVFNSLFVSK